MKTASMTSMPASRATRRAGLLKHIASLFAGLACLALAPRAGAQSGTITLTSNDATNPVNSSWDAAGRWSDGQAPHSDADYLLGNAYGAGSDTRLLVTPQVTGGTLVFGGKSLTLRNFNPGLQNASQVNGMVRPQWGIYNTGPLIIKSTNTRLVINDLRLESYSSQAMITLNQATADNFVTLAGNITLVSGASRLALESTARIALQIESNISGDGDIWFSNNSGISTGGGSTNSSTDSFFTLAGNNSHTGVTRLTGLFTLRLDSDTALGNTSGVTFGLEFRDYTNAGPYLLDGGATIDLNGHNADLGALSGTWATSRITNRAAGTTGTATITVASGTTLYAGILNNALAVAKAGSGTLVLTGASNTWSGDTTISGGLLLVQGIAGSNAASSVNIHSGGALAGTGTVGGIVRVQNGGALHGNAGSTLTIGGLVLAGAALDTTLGAPSTTPLFQVDGDVTLGGRVNIADATLAPGAYALANYTGALNADAGLAIGDVSGAVDKLILTVDTATAGKINLVYADADYWLGGAGAWDATTQNFTDYTATGSHVWRAGVLAEFRGSAATVTTSGTVTASGLVFATDSWQLAGGAITLANPASIIRVGDATSAAATFTATIASTLTGAGGLEKTDLGALVFAGDNTYAGATIVREGTLILNGSHFGAGPVTVKTGARLSGAGVTTATATIENGGILAATAGSAPLTLGGLALSASSQLNLALGAPVADTLFQINGDLTLDGILNITDAGGFGAGLYRVFNYTGALTDHGVSFGATAGVADALLSLNTDTAGQVNLIYQAANLWNTGNGAWSASGTTQWILGEGNTTAATGFALFSGAPATVTVDNTTGSITPLGMQFANGGWLVTGGTLITASDAETTGILLRVGDGAPASAAFSATIASTIAGTGGIEKNDYGTLVLAGNNTYTGDTIVRLGTLLVDGAHAAAGGAGGDYHVRENGALGGSGRIDGTIAIEDGGILLGAAGATLTTGNLTLSEGAAVSIALGAPAQYIATAAALFRVNGDLVLDGTLNITDAGGIGPGLYRIFEYTGALDDRGLEFGTLPTGAYGTESLLTLDTAATGQINLLYGTADFWPGGSGEWNATTANWTDSAAGSTHVWNNSFAIFRGASGTVTVNSSDTAPVRFNGAQFAVDGYVVDGNMLLTTVEPSIIRVGDGSEAGAGITATIAAELNGQGGIDKTDLGTLVLAGNNTYTGATRLKAGATRLVEGSSISAATIFPGARLEGAGTVRGNLLNNGILAPAIGAGIIINGAYTQTTDGSLVVTLDVPPNFTRIRMTGAATLAGELTVRNTPAFAPNPGSYFTILSASSITGVFDTLNATGTLSGPYAGMSGNWGHASQMLLFEVLYGATDVRLSFTQLPYASTDALPGLTENQRAIGASIDTLLAAGVLPAITSALNTLQTENELVDPEKGVLGVVR